MASTSNIPTLSQGLFWDTHREAIDYERQARAIIARVLMRGTLEDWFAIKEYYGIERLKKEVVQIRYLDKVTLNFCHVYFDIPLEQFRCYTTEPSIRQLWDY